jgi:AcrR family transcriptional regulator
MTKPGTVSFIELLAARMREEGMPKSERTRASIRWATAVVLEETGYASFSMNVVALKAQVSRPAIYQYYANKHDCVLDVMGEFLTAVVQFLERDSKAKRVAATDLLSVVSETNRYYIAFYRANASLVERVREMRQDLPELITLQQDVNRQWAERLAKHISRNSPLRLKAALFTAYLLESMVDDFLREYFVMKSPHLAALGLSDDELALALSEVWIRAAYGSYQPAEPALAARKK